MVEKLKRFESNFKGKVLDVGAGDKPYRYLFTSVNSYISTNTRRHYKNQTSELERFTDYWIEDASELPFEPEEMDGILCFQVLSVVQKPELFFKEVNRVLKPGGKFLLTTDFLYPTWSNKDHARYSKQQLEKFVVEAGLTVLKSESFGGINSLFYSLLSRRIRSYVERIKDAPHILIKLVRGLTFIVYLILLPLISVWGWLVFLFDKTNRDDFDFTFNLLLYAQKPGL